MSSVGSKLKKAREKKHLSWEEVSQKTKIHPKILELLEEDRAPESLSRFYVMGFLRNYAHFVELNGEELVREYSATATKDPSPTPPETLESGWEEEIGVSPWVGRTLFIIVIVAFFFLLGIGLSKGKGGKKHLPPPMAQRASLSIKKGTPVAYPFRIPQSEPLTLRLRVQENSWIRVQSDGRLMYQGLLTKGKEEVWVAHQQFELSLSDGGAVWFGLNRKPLGILGEKGRPLEKLMMTRESWRVGEGE